MINLGISLLNFKPEYSGGINSFSLGLLKPLEKKCKLHIFTNRKSYDFLKKKFPKSKITIFSKNNLLYLFIQTIALFVKSEKLFKYNELIYFNRLNKKINSSCNVFYCPLSYLKPLGLKIPTVTSIHDLQHYHMPKNFNFIQLKYRKLMYKITIENTTIIQASTNFIKDDIKKIYPKTNKKKITVINEGISSDFTFKKFNRKNNFIFFPAQLWPHKNHLIVLKSLKEIYNKNRINLKLIMVGGKFSAFKEINNFILENKHLNIKYLGKVSFSKLRLLYKNCKFIISPAIYESSSIPILEACKIGRPIIASKSKSNLEMSKKIKMNLFKTQDTKDLTKLILKIWSNNKLIKNQINFNKLIIKNYSWDKISNEYLKIFKNLNKNNT
jgi:glycosyltransferase involved in cell wall biosynthesis